MTGVGPPPTAIEVLYVDGCPNVEVLLERLQAVLAGNGHSAVVTLREVSSDDEARALRFFGSPTLRVDGRDVEPARDATAIYGLGCRIYRTARGACGAPPDALIRDALARAMNSPRGAGSRR